MVGCLPLHRGPWTSYPCESPATYQLLPPFHIFTYSHSEKTINYASSHQKKSRYSWWESWGRASFFFRVHARVRIRHWWLLSHSLIFSFQLSHTCGKPLSILCLLCLVINLNRSECKRAHTTRPLLSGRMLLVKWQQRTSLFDLRISCL